MLRSKVTAMQPTQELDSDSEDDADYVPPADEVDSEPSDEEPQAKRPRTTSPQATAEDQEAKKHARDDLWSTFQASVSTPAPVQTESQPKRMIKIEKRYLFAGEPVVR